jgi:hypothetical protein
MSQKIHEIYMFWIHFRTFQKIHGWILRPIYLSLSLYIYYNALVFLIRWNKVFCIAWVIHASVNSTRKTMSDLRGVAHICMYVMGLFLFWRSWLGLNLFSCLLLAPWFNLDLCEEVVEELPLWVCVCVRACGYKFRVSKFRVYSRVSG